MELDFDDALMWSLRGYVRRVTEALGLSGECSYVQADRPAVAYLALDGRLPGFPDQDVALLWDEERGWSAAVETHSGEELVVRARYGPDVLPAPDVVARWARGLFRGEQSPPRPGVPTQQGRNDLARRLVPYGIAVLIPAQRRA